MAPTPSPKVIFSLLFTTKADKLLSPSGGKNHDEQSEKASRPGNRQVCFVDCIYWVLLPILQKHLVVKADNQYIASSSSSS
jgi:hypothetical protein